MIKKTKLKWFTMLEMLIVMVIIWILAIVLTESYITISKTALRIEQEKNISEESLILTQIFQSIADETTIDYDKYDVHDLESNNWYVDTLFLKWWEWESYSISTEWNCLNLEWNFKLNEDGSIKTDDKWNIPDIQDFVDCKLILEDKDGDKDGDKTVINTSWKVIVSKVRFRVIPYNTDQNYFDNATEWSFVINDIHQPAFWMFIHLYSPLYQPTWTNNVHQPLQLFFNLNL